MTLPRSPWDDRDHQPWQAPSLIDRNRPKPRQWLDNAPRLGPPPEPDTSEEVEVAFVPAIAAAPLALETMGLASLAAATYMAAQNPEAPGKALESLGAAVTDTWEAIEDWTNQPQQHQGTARRYERRTGRPYNITDRAPHLAPRADNGSANNATARRRKQRQTPRRPLDVAIDDALFTAGTAGGDEIAAPPLPEVTWKPPALHPALIESETLIDKIDTYLNKPRTTGRGTEPWPYGSRFNASPNGPRILSTPPIDHPPNLVTPPHELPTPMPTEGMDRAIPGRFTLPGIVPEENINAPNIETYPALPQGPIILPTHDADSYPATVATAQRIRDYSKEYVINQDPSLRPPDNAGQSAQKALKQEIENRAKRKFPHIAGGPIKEQAVKGKHEKYGPIPDLIMGIPGGGQLWVNVANAKRRSPEFVIRELRAKNRMIDVARQKMVEDPNTPISILVVEKPDPISGQAVRDMSDAMMEDLRNALEGARKHKGPEPLVHDIFWRARK